MPHQILYSLAVLCMAVGLLALIWKPEAETPAAPAHTNEDETRANIFKIGFLYGRISQEATPDATPETKLAVVGQIMREKLPDQAWTKLLP
jgi:hypothetical protein